MMKKYLLTFMIAALAGLSILPDVIAAQSLTKSYKVSVTLPQAVGIAPLAEYQVRDITSEIQRMYTEITVIVRDNQEMLLKTVVVQ